MFGEEEKVAPLDDAEVELLMRVILAAYAEHFPQLRGKPVRPDRRDDARAAFAKLMVEKLRQSGVRFFRCVTDSSKLMLTSGTLSRK
jgi:hypothetical protein